jgi:hypothetical protein
MISVQLGVGIEEALGSLRAQAFVEGRRLFKLAADVVASRLRCDTEHPTSKGPIVVVLDLFVGSGTDGR